MFIGYGRKGAGEKIIARAENKNADTAAKGENQDKAVTANNTAVEANKTERKKKTTVSTKEAEANG